MVTQLVQFWEYVTDDEDSGNDIFKNTIIEGKRVKRQKQLYGWLFELLWCEWVLTTVAIMVTMVTWRVFMGPIIMGITPWKVSWVLPHEKFHGIFMV